MLHCTANYLARQAKDPYHSCPNVQQALGKKFTLAVSGFVYSSRSISARVDLYTISESKGKGLSSVVHDRKGRKPVKELLDLFAKEEEGSLREKYGGLQRGESSPEGEDLFRHGCSAHITISYAQNGQPKSSGDDILSLCEQEYNSSVWKEETCSGVVSSYGGSIYQVSLKHPIMVDCLFHGFYTSYR